MSRTKILYAASSSDHLLNFHLSTLRWLQVRGCAVHAAAVGSGAGIDCDVFLPLTLKKSMSSPGNFVQAMKLAGILRREDYDLVVTNTSLAAFFVRLAIILSAKRPIITINIVHGYLFDENTPPLLRALLLGAERLTACVTDYILTMNSADTKTAMRYKLYQKDVAQIPGMGFDAERFVPPTGDERQRNRDALGMTEDDFVMLYAADFSLRKNQAFLVRTLAHLPENARLVLAGNGAQIDRCKRLAARLGVTKRVHFLGHVQDIVPLCHGADICVSSSRTEGLPFFVMEAMSCGIVPVLSDIKGHRDLVTHGENGFLYRGGDPGELAATIRELMLYPSLSETVGSKARASVARFSKPYAMEEIARIFSRILDNKEEL